MNEVLHLKNRQANAVLDMPLKKLTNLERKQIEIDIKNHQEKKEYFNKILQNRELLLELLIEELKTLKKKYNIKRKTKILKNIDQDNEIKNINNQILEELINKKTKLIIDNRLYLRKIVFNNYKKLIDNYNQSIDNKTIQKFICTIEKNLKIIGVTLNGKIFSIDWESNINSDYKLDNNKDLGNTNPNEIINFHSINKKIKNYLCTLNSDGRFKKVFFDEDMVKSNRTFTITKLKNNIKIIDSFISNGEENLIILTSIGRILKFNLSSEYIPIMTKQSQGLLLTKLLPTERIVSCCKIKNEIDLFLISQKGKIFCVSNNEIYYSNDSTLGYLNDNTQLKDDYFIKILPSNHFIDIETNKNKSARLSIDKLSFKSNKNNFLVDLINLEKDEYLENCFVNEDLIN